MIKFIHQGSTYQMQIENGLDLQQILHLTRLSGGYERPRTPFSVMSALQFVEPTTMGR